MREVNDQLGLAYSLKMFIEEETSIPSLIHFDGMETPKEKPFTIVKQRSTQTRFISKKKETALNTFSYEIGLFDSSYNERTKHQDELRNLFLFKDIPLFNRDGDRVKGAFFTVELENQTTLDAEDITDETRRHRMYFDIEIEGIIHKN